MLSNAAERRQRLIDHRLRGLGLGEVCIDDQRFRTGFGHRLRRLFQIGTVPRNQNKTGKIACEAHGRGLADALAGPCHNCNRIRHFITPGL
jgi:hypothetical protein